MMNTQTNTKQIDLAKIREQLAHTQGQQYWRSLEELADTEEFQQFVENEFPHGLMNWENPVGRRTFLKLMGASMALAGLTACGPGPLQPVEKIIPHVTQPPEESPGNALYFATAMIIGGYATGLVVETHEGRPTKIEGNPDHPASLGATTLFAQGEILTMYDPDRSQVVRKGTETSSWDAFIEAVAPKLEGNGVRILTETVSSPTLISQIEALRKQYPSIKWYQYETAARDNVHAGARMAFGEAVETYYQVENAKVILSLESDFLGEGPGAVVYSRHFMDGRRVRKDATDMNRLYVAESSPTVTGSIADHRLPLRSCEIEDFARQIASSLGLNVEGTINDIAPEEWVEAVVEDLQDHKGESLVVVGEGQPPEVHALAHAINQKLGNIGSTVICIEPVAAPAEQVAGLSDLAKEMQAGKVNLLLILGGNPVYTAPADLAFGDALANVETSVHLGLYEDETSALCTWHLPETHFLEAWGDGRAYDGTASVTQPMIAPLYLGKAASEVLAIISGQPDATAYDIVKTYWLEHLDDASERGWEAVLQNGLVEGSSFAAKEVNLAATSFPRSPKPGDGLEIVFRTDPTIADGRYANNGWLQETPKPLTRITWDNVALISPATAEKLGVESENQVKLRYQGAEITAPVWVMPGHANDSITVHLGYGRTHAGQLGTGVGFNAYTMRTTEALWCGTGVQVGRSSGTYPLASTQNHHSIKVKNPDLKELKDERELRLMRAGTIQAFREEPESIHHLPHLHGEEGDYPSLYPPLENTWGEGPPPEGDEEARNWAWIDEDGKWKGARWGMVIDLNVCDGCNACVVACQAENNIPIVGKEEVLVGREMHWIRIDRYYRGDVDNPEIYNQPLGCVHCEQAPCEPVCPVAATSHSLEGINEMTYNRCVGTRYCANNCPYKVRRFNFYQYSDLETESFKLMRNPNVTVRNRGVMEKCTYCVQRINLTRIYAKRELGQTTYYKQEDGDIVPACAQACPTQAITFGDISDPESRVAQLREEPHHYALLGELGVRPRTTYLARLRNPNPKLEPMSDDSSSNHH
jgi:molybdopterin-containing oxidoreductase family iron-sulfur binding subunit